MSTKNLPYQGSATALITPFCSDGSVDYDSLGTLIEFQISSDTDALVILGTTGESATLTDSEKTDIIRFAIKRTNSRVPVIVGTGSNSTAHSVEMTKVASRLGCDAVLAVTPYYNKPSQNGLVAHFTAVADASSVPVILYNVPSRTGVDLSIGALKRLAEHERIAGLKDAGGNISATADIIAEMRDSLYIYSGNDDMTVPIMSLGGRGVISVLANIMPRQMHDLCCEMLIGTKESAAEMQLGLIKIMKAMFCESNPIPVKFAASEMGLCKPHLRLPLTQAGENNAIHIKNIMKEYGLI